MPNGLIGLFKKKGLDIMAKELENGLSKNDISRIITYALELKGISARELAKRVDVSQSSMCGYMSGNTLPSEEVWNKICTVLDIPPSKVKGSFSNNRQDYVVIETEHRRERMKKWIGMLYYLGYSFEDIADCVDDFVDYRLENVLTDTFNELAAATIMGL